MAAPSWFAAGLLVSLMAGCSEAPEPVTPPDPEPVVAVPPVPVREEAAFTWAAGVGLPPSGLGAQVFTTNAATIMLDGNSTRLRAFANWTCATVVCDLHLYLQGPGDGGSLLAPGGTHAMGASPQVLEAMDPAAGEWTVVAFPHGASALVEGTFVLVGDSPGAVGESGAPETP